MENVKAVAINDMCPNGCTGGEMAVTVMDFMKNPQNIVGNSLNWILDIFL